MPNVDINGTVVAFPDNMPPDQLKSAVSMAAGKMGKIPQKPQQQQSFNPLDLIQKLAPSNVMKQAGIAGVNAPGVTGALLGSLPGSNPSEIMPSLRNIQQNPNQLKNAFQRTQQVSQGSPMTPTEKIPANIGQAAGTMMEMTAPSFGTEGMKAKTPFMAGIKDPGTALPGAMERAGSEYGISKTLARQGEDPKEALRLRMMLTSPSGTSKLAEEAMMKMRNGTDASVTHLLAYRDALGKMQAEGGTFANDYKIAKDMTTKILSEKSPDLIPKMEKMATNYAAKGKPKTFPWFISAVDPKMGALKAATMPGVQNAAGAAVSPAVRFPAQIATILSQIRKKREDSNP